MKYMPMMEGNEQSSYGYANTIMIFKYHSFLWLSSNRKFPLYKHLDPKFPRSWLSYAGCVQGMEIFCSKEKEIAERESMFFSTLESICQFGECM